MGCGGRSACGPGAPAYVYVAHEAANELAQPLSGWMGHARAFEFAGPNANAIDYTIAAEEPSDDDPRIARVYRGTFETPFFLTAPDDSGRARMARDDDGAPARRVRGARRGLMHLLAADLQRIDEGEEAVDLDLSPAPIIIMSAADGEIAALMAAVHRAPDGPAVRLASLSALTHPMSVDLLAEKTLRHARVIAVRVIGGEAFFAYGIEVLRRLAVETGARLLIVPGEPSFDEALAARGTVCAVRRRGMGRMVRCVCPVVCLGRKSYGDDYVRYTKNEESLGHFFL